MGCTRDRRITVTALKAWLRIVTALISLASVCTFIPRFLSANAEARAKRAGGEDPRHLILCVDGVPFSTVEAMCARGRFGVFRKPARLLAPFPTLTNVGVIEVLKPLGVPESRGYEDYYYDPVRDRMQGGFFARFRRATFIDGTFREAFDYHPSPIAMTFEYAVPPLSPWIDARMTLAQIRRSFEKSDARTYLAYLGATDALAHVGGERMLRNILEALDDTCRGIVLESADRVDVTIFSDHGNQFVRQRKTDLRKMLKQAGFRNGGNLKQDRAVVAPCYGLVGSAVLYASEAEKPRLAAAAAQAEGADFATYLQGDVVHLVSRTGRARIEHRAGWYRYGADSGDPLKLHPILDRLAAAGQVRDDGFVADADFFEAASGHEYPDALRRLWEGVTDHVIHPATVIVSLEDGYYEGSRILDLLAFLQSSHGNLRRSQSEGVLMTTRSDLPEVVRAADAWSLIAGR
jgi:hypothetical protein